MGRCALTSHLKSKKHVSRAQIKVSQGGLLKTWIQSSSNSTCSSDNTNITSYVQKEKVVKAEILWTQSNNCSKNTTALFNAIFLDSSIVKQFSCGPSKCSYLAVYGLLTS